jgi:hypothetical protein
MDDIQWIVSIGSLGRRKLDGGYFYHENLSVGRLEKLEMLFGVLGVFVHQEWLDDGLDIEGDLGDVPDIAQYIKNGSAEEESLHTVREINNESILLDGSKKDLAHEHYAAHYHSCACKCEDVEEREQKTPYTS